MIRSYISDAESQNIKTCKDSLARYIKEKELFGKIRDGVFKPLIFKTIRTYVNEIWKEVEREDNNLEGIR
ncbi:hypothetical protein NXY41_12505 [Bacteroides fragilis]|nr:hypothetical protein [Bacteroides fragilis]MCS2879409.1 hypothetical protein [Bacteroides fragilis]